MDNPPLVARMGKFIAHYAQSPILTDLLALLAEHTRGLDVDRIEITSVNDDGDEYWLAEVLVYSPLD